MAILTFFHLLAKMPVPLFSAKCRAYCNMASFVLFVMNATLRPWQN